MSKLRSIPPRYRVPMVNAALAGMAWTKSRSWIAREATRGPLVATGFFSENSGIGQAGRLTLNALREVGFPCAQHELGPCYRNVLRSDGAFPAAKPGGVWLIQANAQECLVALMAFPPETWASRYRIGCWVWETTRASSLWAWAAQFFHEIWVPTSFVFEVLERTFRLAGREALVARLRLMPHPVGDLSRVKPDRMRFGLEAGAFEMLCLFDTRSTATRKNPWAVINAWVRAFPEPSPKVNLRLKVHNAGADEPTLKRLARLTGGRSDISLMPVEFDGPTMLQFIASFDAIVSLHRSEGFGLTLAEAMAMGVAPVATGWSGNMDFMNEENSYPVPYDLKAVQDPDGMYGKLFGRADSGQLWAEPRVADAALLLRRIVDDSTLAERANLARASIAALSDPWSVQAVSAMPFAKFVETDAA